MIAVARYAPDALSQRSVIAAPQPTRWHRLFARLGNRRAPAAAESELGYESAHPWVLADLAGADGADIAQSS